MLTAVITKLKTGSIPTVIAKGDPIKNALSAYVVVWEDVRLVTGNGQATGGIMVACHNIRGTQDDINNYMEGEVVTLLHEIILTDVSGNKFRLQDTGELSVFVENDDNTLSRDRLFSLPKLGAT